MPQRDFYVFFFFFEGGGVIAFIRLLFKIRGLGFNIGGEDFKVSRKT